MGLLEFIDRFCKYQVWKVSGAKFAIGYPVFSMWCSNIRTMRYIDGNGAVAKLAFFYDWIF